MLATWAACWTLKSIGEFENTLIILISDNGASAEGGPTGSVNENLFFNNVQEDLQTNLDHLDELGDPTTFNHYPWGWTWAGNTPFRRWKRETYRGGPAIRSSCTFPGASNP
jgi:arylsulfatase